MRADLQVGEIRECLRQHGFGVEIFDRRRAAGLVLELLGPVALQQQKAAGL
jgi:hypothetical protein